MARFLKKIILITLIPLLMLAFFEFNLRKMPNSYKLKKQVLEQKLDSVQVLVLGASRALFGIDPSCFSAEGFNLANVSQSIYYDSELTLKYLDRMQSLKCVILDVNYSSLGFKLNESPEQWRDYFYLKEWGVHNPQISVLSFNYFSEYFLFTPEYSFKFLFNRFNNRINMKPNGCEFKDNSSNGINDNNAWFAADYDNMLFKSVNVRENIRRITLLKNKLKNLNIELVLISSPETKNYRKFLDTGHLNELRSAISGLSREQNIRYLDYSNNNNFSDSCFYDCVHLNNRGAELFSAILDTEIIRRLK